MLASEALVCHCSMAMCLIYSSGSGVMFADIRAYVDFRQKMQDLFYPSFIGYSENKTDPGLGFVPKSCGKEAMSPQQYINCTGACA